MIESVAEYLRGLGDELYQTLVVVPTTNSGRRLRMELSRDGGMISPRVIPPHLLFEVENAASRQQTLWAWVKVLQGIEFTDYPHLFPDRSDRVTFGAALSLGRQLMQLRDTLSEGDGDFRDALRVSPEKDRWQDLAKLEVLLLEKLPQWKLSDSSEGKRHRASNAEPPVGITRVVVACVPDPSRLASRALQSLMLGGSPVTVLVHAPEQEAASFDAWGTPLTADWEGRRIDIPGGLDRLHVSANSSDLAQQCVRLFSEGETPPEKASLTLCDSAMAREVAHEFAENGWQVLNPDGRSIADSGLVRIFGCLQELVQTPRPFLPLVELVRIPGAEMFLPEGCGRQWASKLMDQLQTEHLPETISSALALANDEQQAVAKSVLNHLDRLQIEPKSTVLLSWLRRLLASTDKDLAKAAEAVLTESIDAIQHLESVNEELKPEEVIQMVGENLRGVSLSEGSSETVLDMQGWLEVSYDNAPHLVLAGMHEGCVPDGQVDDVFIPDSLRQALNLRDSAGRVARDAFLLTSAIESRRGNGRVDAVLAKFTDSGEARNPSRLLMRRAPDVLPKIVSHLFAEKGETQRAAGAWTRDWTLDFTTIGNPFSPEEGAKPLSPSALKDYFDCPFRFYLKRVLKMRKFEAGKMEMNAMEFGNLCHKVLELFGEHPDHRSCDDAASLSEILSGLLDDQVEKIYGKQLNLPLMVQVESARERLRAFASIQAEDYRNGWRILHTELEVGQGEGRIPWAVLGHDITMTPDRIDRHEDGKQWRVWDYKTFGKKHEPNRKHLSTIHRNEERQLCGELFMERGKEYRWADVQLPLYASFVQEHFKTGELPQIGYINLPRALSDVSFSPWKGFGEEVLESAMAWAESAITSIEQGVFTPATTFSGEQRMWDDFAELAPDGLTQAFQELEENS
ncbi:MAG: PD-(D/E)XK nuclease family protein [Akkermansiaceae bacterium]